MNDRRTLTEEVQVSVTQDKGAMPFILFTNSLAAIRAASLHTLATSAPVKPGVKAANLRDKSSLFNSVLRPAK